MKNTYKIVRWHKDELQTHCEAFSNKKKATDATKDLNRWSHRPSWYVVKE